MGVIRDAGFKNDSCDEYEIDVVFRLAESRWNAYQKNRKKGARLSFIFGFFLRLHFSNSVRNLLAVLKSASFTTDPLFPILVGEFLYKIERFEEAATCFGRAVEILNVPDQDIRLRALMGKLECLIVIQDNLYWGGKKTSSRMRKESEVFYSLICEDLNAVSEELQKSLRSRLCKARFAMDQLAMRIKVRWVSAMLKRCRFGYPD